MQTLILKENVLTDDLLMIADEGKIFKGNYIAILKKYTFQNAWSDKETVKKFRKKEALEKYISSNYPEFNLDF